MSKSKLIPSMAAHAKWCASALALVACANQVPPSTEASPAPASASATASAQVTPAAVTASPASSASAAAGAPGNPCEAKVPGVLLSAVGPWVPEWDDGAGCQWAKKGKFWGIHLRAFPGSLDTKDKLTNIEDLKAAAPMMMEIGTAVTKVIRPVKKTPNGWYVVVQSNEGQSENFVYVRDQGKKSLVCSAVMKSPNDADTVSEAEALAACESIKLKP